jgi:hypothetical protein
MLEISSLFFAKKFHYFLKLSSSAGTDNTEVSDLTDQPQFQRSQLCVPRGASSQITLEAFAYIDEGLFKQLGSLNLPAELPMEPITVNGAQFLRDGRVYGKVNLKIHPSPEKFNISPPPTLELKAGHKLPPSRLPQPLSTLGVAPGVVAAATPPDVVGLLLREHAERSQALVKATDDVVSLQKVNSELIDEISRLKEEVEGEERLAASADGYLTVDALEGLSSEELAQRLRVALNRYRAEREKMEAAKQQVKAAEAISVKLSPLEQEHAELKKQYEMRMREMQLAQAEDEKIETYKQTIIAHEATIHKLERVLRKSMKDVKTAQDNQLALEKLRLENIQLRNAASALKQGTSVTDDEKLRFDIRRSQERITALERQLIEAAKTHAQQLASLHLAQEN